MKYQWILFDADETLFHFNSCEGLQRLFREYGVEFTQQDFEEYEAVNRPLWDLYQHGQLDAASLQIKRFNVWGEKLGVSPKKLNDDFLMVMVDVCQPLEGVKALLDDLAGKVRLALITNGFASLQSLRLAKNNMEDAFEALVISELVGAAKPDAKIFDVAFDMMGNPPKKAVLMVGDSLKSDILGGHQYGIDTCWYNPHRLENNENIEPTLEVSSHQALKAWLFQA